MMTSEQLTALALRARTDRDALDELIAHEAGIVRRWVVSQCKDPVDLNDANDISQEILLSIFRSIGRFRGECSCKTWVFKIMLSRLCDWRIRQLTAKFSMEDLYANMEQFCGSYEMELPVESDELEAACVRLLSECPLHYREVIERHYLNEETFVSIASSEGISYAGIRSRHRRGMKWLREHRRDHEKTVFDRVV